MGLIVEDNKHLPVNTINKRHFHKINWEQGRYSKSFIYQGFNGISILDYGKYTQFRDYLETKQFHFGKAEIKNGELKEFKFECDKCKRHIILGID